jgi:hypothetical protein
VIHASLPSDFRSFLLEDGGGAGFIGEGYTVFHGPDELVDAHRGLRADEFFPDLIIIGSDGGGELFAIDRGTGRYVMTPGIGDEPAIRVDAGGTFAELIEFVRSGSPI